MVKEGREDYGYPESEIFIRVHLWLEVLHLFKRKYIQLHTL